ncbi:MAG: D-glycero-beta-D-manno-heptose-7-phosphate kinase [Acidobacteria bacterium]|nr:D-glycero-beta-D-manno-heptose-7-phosphate kinase [Acidobacteriota bacterium]
MSAPPGPGDPAALERLRGRPVLVIGDAILDRYVWGHVDRISPEAPVPVVRLHSEEVRPGGAANVAANVLSLGAVPLLVSIVGDDAGGAALARVVRERGGSEAGLVEVRGRRTTVKTRVIARHQQVVRVDEETDDEVPAAVAAEVLRRAVAALPNVEAVIVSDYAKGLLDARVVPELLREARQRRLPVVIDPKIRHFDLFAPATVMTPNEAEAARATGREIRTERDVVAAAGEILERLELDAVLVTRGEEGMMLLARGGAPRWIRATAREVFDVTGAGDTVAATLGVALAAGFPLGEAALWANAAAGIAVGRIGTAAVSIEELARPA